MMIETSRMGTDELERHVFVQDRILRDLVQDFGPEATQSQSYANAQKFKAHLEQIIGQRWVISNPS